MRRAICIAVLLVSPLLAQGVDLPVLPETIQAPIARRRPDLVTSLAALRLARTATLDGVGAFKRTCGEFVVVGSKEDKKCEKELPDLLAAAKAHLSDSVAFLADLATEVKGQAVIDGINAMARRLRWDDAELKRLDLALNRLRGDGAEGVTGAEVSAVWRTMRARGDGGDLKRDAANGQGPAFLASAPPGSQAGNDCTIFAIANASGEPYGVVASRAALLISEAGWRPAAERAAPQREIERRGLMGGEVIMLAEAFGEVEVVPSERFAATLKAGQSVMVSVFPDGTVFPADGTPVEGHQVTLTRTFQRGTETWYELIDSNQGADKRSYLSATELTTILQENGVAFRPNAKNIPRIPK